jgi:phosphoribosylformylglycinamidine cyclo-ligase
VEGPDIIKDKLFPVPSSFKLIQAESGTGWQAMYKLFNTGHCTDVYVPGEIAEYFIKYLKIMALRGKESTVWKNLTKAGDR